MTRKKCQSCLIYINDKYYMRHLFSKKHLKNMSRINNKVLEDLLSLKNENNRYFDKSFQ